MRRRTALLWITLSLAGGLLPLQAAAGVAELHRPILAVWSAQVGPEGTSWCRHCDRFWQDFRENAAFRRALCSRYRVVYINADHRRLEGTLLRGITALPTFTAPGRRIVGYTSPADLLARLELSLPDRELPPAGPTRTDVPPQAPVTQPATDEPPSDETTREDFPPADTIPVATVPEEPPPAQPQPGNREFNAPGSPPAPIESGTDSRTPAEQPGGTAGTGETPVEPAPRPPTALPAVVSWLARPVALYFGGPLAAAAVGAAGWWWGRRQQRRSASQQEQLPYHRPTLRTAQQTNEEPASSPGEEPRTETRYVRVPVADQEGEAWREAVRRMAELHPGAVPLLNTLESTASQLLHGRKVTSGSSHVRPVQPGLWNDPPP